MELEELTISSLEAAFSLSCNNVPTCVYDSPPKLNGIWSLYPEKDKDICMPVQSRIKVKENVYVAILSGSGYVEVTIAYFPLFLHMLAD